MFDTTSIFTSESGLDWAFNETGPRSNLEVLTYDKSKRVCNKYDGCIIHLHECMISFIGRCLPFKNSRLAF